MLCGTPAKEHHAEESDPPAATSLLSELLEKIPGAKEKHSPHVAPATSRQSVDFQMKINPHSQYRKHEQTHRPHPCHRFQTCMRIHQLVKQQKHYARHKQTAEKPESTGYEFIVARHLSHNGQQTSHPLFQCVGVCDTSGPVSVGLVQHTDVKPHVMEQQKQHRPFQKRQIQPFETPGDKRPRIRQIFPAEEKPCRHKEQRHVEFVDKVGEPLRTFCVTRNN
jgi:hypothetical protein